MFRKIQALFSFAVVATVVTTVATTYTTSCVGLVHEPEMPQELKK